MYVTCPSSAKDSKEDEDLLRIALRHIENTFWFVKMNNASLTEYTTIG